MNLEPEKRRNYYISAEMKSVWAVEIELLKKLLYVCEKYRLKVWAEGGTLLGAVREHGFIPWDDDIDMAMLREDYDKLQIIATKEFQPPYFFQSGHTDYLPTGMSKIRMNDTAAIERISVFNNHHQGIFIDIFPLDTMPDNQHERGRYLETVLKLRQELNTYCYHTYSLTNWKYNINVYKTVLKVKIKGFHKCFGEYENYVKKYTKSNYNNLSLVAWCYKDRYLRNKDWYQDTKLVPFEDILIPIPSGYHDILTKQFGDYMTPLKAPSMHEGFICLDSKNDYSKYLPVLRRKYNQEAWKHRIGLLLKFMRLS